MKHQQPGMALWECPETLQEAKGMIEELEQSRRRLIAENQMMRCETFSTDDAIKEVLQSGQHQKVKAEFARGLERRLQMAYKEIEILRAIVEDGAQWHDTPKGNDPTTMEYNNYTHFDHPSLAITCRKALNELRGKSV